MSFACGSDGFSISTSDPKRSCPCPRPPLAAIGPQLPPAVEEEEEVLTGEALARKEALARIEALRAKEVFEKRVSAVTWSGQTTTRHRRFHGRCGSVTQLCPALMRIDREEIIGRDPLKDKKSAYGPLPPITRRHVTHPPRPISRWRRLTHVTPGLGVAGHGELRVQDVRVAVPVPGGLRQVRPGHQVRGPARVLQVSQSPPPLSRRPWGPVEGPYATIERRRPSS
jgi:hypothetical protein